MFDWLVCSNGFVTMFSASNSYSRNNAQVGGTTKRKSAAKVTLPQWRSFLICAGEADVEKIKLFAWCGVVTNKKQQER